MRTTEEVREEVMSLCAKIGPDRRLAAIDTAISRMVEEFVRECRVTNRSAAEVIQEVAERAKLRIWDILQDEVA